MAAEPFKDRVAVVTGGSAGIGLGIAHALGDSGARVAIWARREKRANEARNGLAEQGVGAIAISCDVGDEGSIEQAMAATLAAFGRVDIVVANAGRSFAAPLLDTPLAEWNRVLNTNLTGAFLAFRAGVRDMIARGDGGALLAIGSLAGIRGDPGVAGYCASKAGLGGLVHSLAVELAEHRIRCNALLPGFTANSSFGPESVGRQRGRAVDAAIPAGRWGTPEDIARAALYLADPTLSYHTGASVVVDGGLSLMPPERAAMSVLD